MPDNVQLKEMAIRCVQVHVCNDRYPYLMFKKKKKDRYPYLTPFFLIKKAYMLFLI